MRIDDASNLSDKDEQHLTDNVPSSIVDTLRIVYLDANDPLEAVLTAVIQGPTILVLALQSQLFTKKQDFIRLKATRADIISFVLPQELMEEVGRYAYQQGFHFTSQLSKAQAVFLERHQEHHIHSRRTSALLNTTARLVHQEENFVQESVSLSQHAPVTPLSDALRETLPLKTAAMVNKPKLWPLVAAVAVLVIVSAILLPVVFPAATKNAHILPRYRANGAAPPESVGNVVFTSSNQLDPMSSVGLNDKITVFLENVTPPMSGMSAYAWLLSDKTQDEFAPILLGKLTIVGRKALLTYQNMQHSDLLVHYSRFLVTEQASNSIPNTPPLDQKFWFYQASIPNTPTPGDEKGYSLLSHLRHLLAADPTLHEIGLQGGLDIWLYRNMGKILEWSNAARDDWSGNTSDLLRRQVDRVVQYLDGEAYAFRELPPKTAWLVDPLAGRPGLIDFDIAENEQELASYISHVKIHLSGMANAPGHTEAQQQLAAHIDSVLTTVESLLKRVRSDAVQLAKMNDRQLQQQAALSILDDMQANATTAYVGQTDPSTGVTVAGEVWVHAQMQSLATLPITTTSTVVHEE